MTRETSQEELVEAVMAGLDGTTDERALASQTQVNTLGRSNLAKLTGLAATIVMLSCAGEPTKNDTPKQPEITLPSGNAEGHEHCGSFYTCSILQDGEGFWVNLYPNRYPVGGIVEIDVPNQPVIREQFDAAPELNRFHFPYPKAVKVTIKVSGEEDIIQELGQAE